MRNGHPIPSKYSKPQQKIGLCLSAKSKRDKIRHTGSAKLVAPTGEVLDLLAQQLCQSPSRATRLLFSNGSGSS